LSKSVGLLYWPNNHPILSKVAKRYEEDLQVEVKGSETIADLQNEIKLFSTGLVLLYAQKQEDIVPQITLLKLLKKELVKRSHRVLVVTPIRQKIVHQLYQDFGASDIWIEDPNTKSLEFKVDRFIGIYKKFAELKSAQNSSSEPIEIQTEWQPELKTLNDFWIFDPTQTARVLDKWVLGFMGPHPELGEWQGVAPLKWRWVFNKKLGLNPFESEKGDWIFEGERPHFTDSQWRWTSKIPKVYFDNGSAVQILFQCDGHTQKIATASATQDKFKAMIQAHLKDYKTPTLELEITQRLEDLMKDHKDDPETDFDPKKLLKKLEQFEKSALEEIKKEISSVMAKSFEFQDQFPGGNSLTPVLSPLAFGFLISELTSKRQQSLDVVVEKFLKLFSAACGGLKTSLWKKQDLAWFPLVGESDKAIEGDLAHLENSKGLIFDVFRDGVNRKYVSILNADHKAHGALALENDQNTYPPPEFLTQLSGLLTGFYR
jgi:hypothetical protein